MKTIFSIFGFSVRGRFPITWVSPMALVLVLTLVNLVAFTAAQAPKNKKDYREIKWEDLLSGGETVGSLMKKYQDQIYRLQDSDPSAASLFDRLQSELDKLPPQ